MEISSTQDVHSLPEAEKQSLEHLLGAPLDDGQKVFILAFTPDAAPDASARNQSADAIERILGKGAAHASRQGVTDGQIDEAVDEAMNEVRRR